MQKHNPAQNLEYFKTHQNTTLPYAISIDSGLPGAHMMVIGAIHGHEPAGVEAMVEFHTYLTSKKVALKRGKLTLAIGHPEAYREQVRFISTNLNRAFSPELSDDIEGIRAQEIRDFFSQNTVDLLLDLHSVSVGEFTMVAYLKNNPKGRELALNTSSLDLHFIPDPKTLPHSLLEEVSKYGGYGLAIECGNNNSARAPSVGLYHIIETIEYLDLIDRSNLPSAVIHHKPETVTIYEVIQPIRPKPGFRFLDEENVTTGTFVKQGEVFVTFDEGEYRAPQDCYIVMPDKHPKLADTDAGFLCTSETVSIKKRQIITSKNTSPLLVQL